MNARHILAAAFFLAALPAHADESDLSAAEIRVYSPAVERGERELETLMLATKGGQQGLAFAAGYSPTSFWAAEVYDVFHRDPGGALRPDEIELENRFSFGAPGRFLLDSGALVELELPQHSEGHGAVRAVPILEKQLGRTVASLNVPLEWQYGTGAAQGTTLAYAARVEYLLRPEFSPAVEAFGEPGLIGSFPAASEQNHLAGPAVYFAAGRRVKGSVAALFGLTPAAPSRSFAARLEFEF